MLSFSRIELPRVVSTDRFMFAAHSIPNERSCNDAMPAIALRDLTKSFRRFTAIQSLTVDFPQGVTGLLGPNGAGKSTLIKILLGLLRATSGSATVLGREVWSQQRLIRELVGYMPEDDCYLPSLSGVECVQLAAKLTGYESLESLRRAHEILDFCGAGQERYRTVETYSVGMRQKLKFAQAIVHDPPLLILDEPTSGLDPDEREAMLQRVQWLSRDHGKSIVLCTHILPDIQQVSDYVVILSAGRIAVANTLAELIRPSSPAMLIRTIGAATELLNELRRHSIECQSTSFDSLTVMGDDRSLLSQIWMAARTAQTNIRSLTPSQNSMESIFLQAVQASQRDNDHANR